jgi:hypothetical protein
MAKSGLMHIDVGPELSRTEWESQETHELVHGTSFPGTPVEKELFYRDDLHEWYIYDGSAWVSLQGAGGGGSGDMTKAVYDTNDDGVVNDSDKLEGSTKAQVQDHAPKAHTLASHSTKAHSELTDVTSDQHHAQLHAASHQLAGADVISVGGLSGELAADQPPKSHDNTKHTTNYASDHDLSTHVGTEAAPVHGSTDAATFSKIVHRDAAGRAKVVNPSVDADIDNQGARNTAIATHAALTSGVHGAGANTLWHGGSTDVVNRTHLSQIFGPSSTRLTNIILQPIAGSVLQIDNTRAGPFTALINGTPTTTSVVYDTDVNEDMFKGLLAPSGADRWGRIMLYNSTRGTYRKIVSVNLTTNTITTEASTDTWADNDSLTTASQVCTGSSGFFDVDLSAKVGTKIVAVLCSWKLKDKSGVDQDGRTNIIHPYEATDWGKIGIVESAAALQSDTGAFWMPVISQKMCVWFRNSTDSAIFWTIMATAEYADAET